MYNMSFTAAPIVYYSIFDWQYTKVELMGHPSLYLIGLNNEKFNAFVFWESFIVALIQGGILTLLTFLTLDGSAGLAYTFNKQTNSWGFAPTFGSVHLNGAFLYQAIVVIVNVKIMIASSIHSGLSLFLQFGSIGVFYACYYILNL